MDQFNKFRITARALIIHENKLLFVSDDGKFWYTPGGQLETQENLAECAVREVYEETGLIIKIGPLLYVLECLDLKDYIHKIHFYFKAQTIEGALNEQWHDTGGSVVHHRYFDLNEIQENKNIVPRFLAKGDWLSKTNTSPINVYQGSVLMHGFELVEEAI